MTVRVASYIGKVETLKLRLEMAANGRLDWAALGAAEGQHGSMAQQATAVVRRGSAVSWQRGGSASTSAGDVAWLARRRGGSVGRARASGQRGWHGEPGTWTERRRDDMRTETQAKCDDSCPPPTNRSD